MEALLPFVLLFFLIPIPFCSALLSFSSWWKGNAWKKQQWTLCQDPRHKDTQILFCTWTRGPCHPAGSVKLAVLPSGTGCFQVTRICCCSPLYPVLEAKRRELVPELPWERRVAPSFCQWFHESVAVWRQHWDPRSCLGRSEQPGARLSSTESGMETARSCASLRCLSDARQSSGEDAPGFGSRAGEWELLSRVTVLWVHYVRVSYSRETFIR